MNKLPINLTNLLHQRTIESERVEYKVGWSSESIVHTLSAFANVFHNLGGGLCSGRCGRGKRLAVVSATV